MTDRSREETLATDDRVLGRLAGQSVVVTGGAGFIGSRLAAALARVCDVTVLDHFSTGDPDAVPDAATVVRGDVRDVDAVHEVTADADVVFHQAAMASVGRSVRSPVECHAHNASGTMTVLDAARRTDTRVVFASSAAIYGHPESVPIHESDPKTPTSPYGVAKLAGDQYVRAFADLYGLPTVVLRYFNVYGDRPGGDDVVSQFADSARGGDPLVVHGDGSQTRDFVHVDDVVRANLRAAVTDATGRAYNVGTGDPTSIRDLADLVRDAADGPVEVTSRPGREADIDRSHASVRRAREHLGFEATVDLADRIGALLGGSNSVEAPGRSN